MPSCAPPNGFICPISLEIMEDPVMLIETGHSFERKAIETWLQSHSSCPKTNKDLRDRRTTPNWALKSSILDWRANHAEKLLQEDLLIVEQLGRSTPATLPKVSDALRIVRLLLHRESEPKDAAIRAIARLLSPLPQGIDGNNTGPHTLAAILAAGKPNPFSGDEEDDEEDLSRVSLPDSLSGIPDNALVHLPKALVVLLSKGPLPVQQLSAQVMWHLVSARGLSLAMAEADPIGGLVSLMQNHTLEENDTAAFNTLAALAQYPRVFLPGGQGAVSGTRPLALLVPLLSGDGQTALRILSLLGQLAVDKRTAEEVVSAGTIPALLPLLAWRAPAEGVVLLCTLSRIDTNRMPMVGDGAAVPLVRALTRSPAEAVPAAEALEQLSRNAGTRPSIVAAGALPPLVQALGMPEPPVLAEISARVLSRLAASGEARGAIFAAGALPLLVRLLAEGTTVGKWNAAAVIRGLGAEGSDMRTMQGAIAKAEAVPPLTRMLGDESPAVRECALGALLNLATDFANQVQMLREENFLGTLVQILDLGTPRMQQFAEGILGHMAGNAAMKAEIISAGAEPLLVRNASKGKMDPSAEALLQQLGYRCSSKRKRVWTKEDAVEQLEA